MDRSQWLAERRKGIGGSDAPVVMGVSPFKSRQELWAEKRGLIEEGEPTAAMKRGTYLEPIVAGMVRESTGNSLLIVDPFQHPDMPFMRANIDRRIITSKKENDGVLEIKCPGLSVFGKCQREGLPDYYQIQAQHYLAVTGWTWGSFAVFSAERWRLETIDFQRDDDLIDQIIRENRIFWDCVESGKMPDDTTPDVDLPPTGGQEIMNLRDPHELAAIRAYEDAKAISSEAGALLDDSKQRLRDIMGPFTIAEGGGWRYYNRTKAGRRAIDSAKVLADFPETKAEKYWQTGKPYPEFRAYNLRGEGG